MMIFLQVTPKLSTMHRHFRLGCLYCFFLILIFLAVIDPFQTTLRCDPTAYFELDSVSYDFYLLNIRSTAKFTDNDKVDIYVKQLKAKVIGLSSNNISGKL